MLLTTSLAVSLPKLLQYIIDESISNQNMKNIILLGITYLIIYIIKTALTLKKEELLVNIKKSVLVKYKLRLMKKVSALSGSKLSNIKSGELLNLIEGDTALLEECGIDIIFDTMSNFMTAVMSIFMLVRLDPFMSLIVLLLQTVIIISQLKFAKLLADKTKKLRKEQGEIYSLIQQYLSNMILVIINGAKKYFFAKFISKERDYIKQCARLDLCYVFFDQFAEIFSALIIVFMYTFGSLRIINDKMSVGELIAFGQYSTLFISPCISLLKSNAGFQKLKVSVDRIHDFLEQPFIIDQNTNGIRISYPINSIEFKNVSFCYSKEYVVNNLSMKLEKGKKYAFVGKTGSGKSTLINLLFRFWEATEGEILVNGINIKKYNLNSLRKRIAVTTQNIFIMNDTIENNILLGEKMKNNYSDICKRCNVDTIINDLVRNNSKLIGENGSTLSGGQKQRISLARSLMQDRDVLVLDEATSALDNITQEKIMSEINPLIQDKIVIFITHRLEFIKNVDKIFVIENGAICEEGTHDQLVNLSGKYAKLVKGCKED